MTESVLRSDEQPLLKGLGTKGNNQAEGEKNPSFFEEGRLEMDIPQQRAAISLGSGLKYSKPAVEEGQVESRGIGRLGYVFAVGWVCLVAYLGAAMVGHTQVADIAALAVMALGAVYLTAKRLQNVGGSGSSAWAMLLPPVGALIFLFCLFAPENYMKTGKLDSPALAVLAMMALAAVASAMRFLG